MYDYGHWIRTPKDKRHYDYVCSECGRKCRQHTYPFCPYCGKEMDLSNTERQRGVYV